MVEKIINYFMFIKISENKYIDSLQKKGHIFCNSIKYFRSIEDNKTKGDKNEGKAFLKQAPYIEIRIDGKTFAKGENAQLYSDNIKDIGNIYCLYGVRSSLIDITKQSTQKVLIENRSKKFGESVLLIHNPKEFLDRVSKELKKISKDFSFSPVKYYDPKIYEGELSPFFKSNIYEYQNEVRLWIPNTVNEPFEFFIGDISDISYKIPVEDLDKIEVEVIKASS